MSFPGWSSRLAVQRIWSLSRRSLVILASIGFLSGPGRPMQTPSPPQRADAQTIALWLFDEPQYPNMTLTDAGPYQNDLRLETGYAKWWQRTEGKGEPEVLPLHVEGKAGLGTVA